ncbi:MULTISPECIES: helix-turn-helix transcriptional regulator [unclassified Leclercia]|uniref:Helix-turn-helix transcriptional regulator n=1 Tax=Leclercia barmai TaxID=2785629 RepID=A0ABS7RZ53_9ENTR|nr:MULTISPECIES: helix-turn-helix transcriptional regulator [unclassified Leclercia]MBZ0059552.1 helix-turn-helix transcriptional regulator [Leclercia sp. EMC7]MCM5697314.1 helix-turn-helix transcriptional regulator [Leclercia sp. LTM01]MCM5702088.1 helix-turn-helix transcriptional regulator [Leclercia sp. LTM14]
MSTLIYRKSLDNLHSNGINTCNLLSSIGLSTYEMKNPHGRITEQFHYQLMEKVSDVNKVVFGSTIPEDVYLNSVELSHSMFPEFIGLCLNETTPEAALQRFAESRFLMGNCDDLIIETGTSHTRIKYHNNAPRKINNPSAMFNLILIGGIIKSYCPAIRMQMQLTDSVIQHHSLLSDLFNSCCQLQQENNAIIIENHYLTIENEKFNALLNRLQINHIDALKNKLFSEPPLTASVNALIEQCYRAGKELSAGIIMEEICQNLRISRWTLNRRLQGESVTFSQLLAQKQLAISMRLLRQSRLSIQEISERLGFSSHSVYSRFFKQHTRITPMQYRDRGGGPMD